MPLSPDDIQNKSFSVTLRRGYEKEEVDGFLAQIAEDYRRMMRAASRADDPYRNVGDEVTEVLRAAKRSAEATKTTAEQEAAAVRKLADDKALEIRDEARREAEASLRDARQEADSLRQQAERHAVDLRRDTERKRSEILDAAVAYHKRLVNHERELAKRVQAIEKALGSLRDELAASPNAGAGGKQPGEAAAAVEEVEPAVAAAPETADRAKDALSEEGSEEPGGGNDSGGGDGEVDVEAEDAATRS